MTSRAWAADHFAARLLAGPWTREAIVAAAEAVLGDSHLRTRAALVLRLAALGERRTPPGAPALRAYLIGSPFFRPARDRPVAAVLDPPLFAPLPPFADLPIPRLATLGELGAWLGLSPDELDWFADERRGHRRAGRPALAHYHYALVPKSGGGQRLIEAPKSRLKAMQRKILHEILAQVPVHPCAHGFVSGRSCLTGASLHAGEAVVATFDLAQFFPSIGLPRIHGVFRGLGYPWAVARRLAGLCTTVTPATVARRLPTAAQPLHGVPHLPQGAPTSPALANLLAWRLDRRLHGLARAAGANYSRYADDLAFSGDAAFAGFVGRFGKAVASIVAEEGFSLNAAKTKIMPRSGRQRVTGIVVNDHINVGRDAFDRLKAILHHCARLGPEGQNRDGAADFRRHLEGRVAWVEQVNPRRGAKLRALFARIAWGAG
jgi:hypothetical protein